MIKHTNPILNTIIVNESSHRYQKWSTMMQPTLNIRREQVLEACVNNNLNKARLIVEEIVSEIENTYQYNMGEAILWENIWREIVLELISQIDEEEQRD